MKKVTLAKGGEDFIKFLVRGQRGSANAVELKIDSEGVIVQDGDAVFLKERLGSNINVEDVDVRGAAKDLTNSVKAAEDLAAEEARRAALTDEERAAEDKAKVEAAEKAAKKAADKEAKKAAKNKSK